MCPSMSKVLDIDRWDLECDFNNTDHRTDLNGVDRLIVRRGQVFTLRLYLRSGSYQPGISSLDLTAETGATVLCLFLPLVFCKSVVLILLPLAPIVVSQMKRERRRVQENVARGVFLLSCRYWPSHKFPVQLQDDEISVMPTPTCPSQFHDAWSYCWKQILTWMFSFVTSVKESVSSQLSRVWQGSCLLSGLTLNRKYCLPAGKCRCMCVLIDNIPTVASQVYINGVKRIWRYHWGHSCCRTEGSENVLTCPANIIVSVGHRLTAQLWNIWTNLTLRFWETSPESFHSPRCRYCISQKPFGFQLSPLLLAGPQPSEQYGTRARFALSADVDTSRWSAAVTSPDGDAVTLSICSAPDAPIGRYTLTLGGSGQIEFILLFNPWCPGV